MSRSLRRINHRGFDWTNWLELRPESMCPPGCTVCGKDKASKKQRKHVQRAADRAAIMEQFQ